MILAKTLRTLAFGAAVVGLSVLGTSAQAQMTYDAAAMFSNTSNPAGVFSYGYTATLGGAFTAYTTAQAFNSGQLAGFQYNGAVPLLGKNVSNSTYSSTQNGSTITIAAGSLFFHPGTGDQTYSVLRFTAPSAGTYTFAGMFSAADDHPTTTTERVLVNSGTVANGVINSYPQTVSLTGSAELAAGGTIDFVVGPTGNGDLFDTTAFTGTVSVPEPSPVALSLVAGAGVFAVSRLRRRKV